MLAQLGVMAIVGIVILGIAVSVLFVVWVIKLAEEAKRRAKERRDAMVALAAEHGFSFVPAPDSSHDEEYAHFGVFQRGFDRFAYNTISGSVELPGMGDGVVGRVKTGDFTYKTRETYTTTDSKGRTTTRTRIVKHNFSYFIFELPFQMMPDLLIRREGVFDRIASVFGSNDIDFESAEFSKKYYVKCESRKFAYDIVNQRMIEYLLESRPGVVDIEFGRISLTDGHSVWGADRFGQSLGWVLEFLEHWPDYVVRDLAEGKAV